MRNRKIDVWNGALWSAESIIGYLMLVMLTLLNKKL